VIELPDSSTFAALLADRRIWVAAGISALAGLVRGFSGFGSALIYMPLIAAVYDPRTAAVTMLLIDFFVSAPFTVREFRRCIWSELLPMWAAASIAVPFGTMTLLLLDPVLLRWGIAFLVFVLLGVLASGWRYKRKPPLAASVGVGLFGGFSAGAVQIAGPAVIVYWLSSGHPAASVRANIMTFFLLTGAVLLVAYIWQGLFTVEPLALSLILGVPYLLAIAVGVYFFHGASEQLYRRVAYLIITVAALLSLPIFDHFLR
jgi:uncharacterized membrane protein YfcA